MNTPLKNYPWFETLFSTKEQEKIVAILHSLEDKPFFPPLSQVFNAFHSLEQAKVIILGQDPYHQEGQANGYAFAVNHPPLPPSLLNIFIEVLEDWGTLHTDCTLKHWVEQGVVLLNTVLTVSPGQPNSHKNLGWLTITNKVIHSLSQDAPHPRVFLLWGKNAFEKSHLINTERHLVLFAPHPSPLSAYRGFYGCQHFSKTNEFLSSQNLIPVDW